VVDAFDREIATLLVLAMERRKVVMQQYHPLGLQILQAYHIQQMLND
jgi:hypothetical protein